MEEMVEKKWKKETKKKKQQQYMKYQQQLSYIIHIMYRYTTRHTVRRTFMRSAHSTVPLYTWLNIEHLPSASNDAGTQPGPRKGKLTINRHNISHYIKLHLM